MTDAKWWQKLTLPLARWAKKKKLISKIPLNHCQKHSKWIVNKDVIPAAVVLVEYFPVVVVVVVVLAQVLVVVVEQFLAFLHEKILSGIYSIKYKYKQNVICFSSIKTAFLLSFLKIPWWTTYVIHPGIFFIENFIMAEIFQPSVCRSDKIKLIFILF